MPSPRENTLAALHARLSALPATVLRGEVLPERVPADGLLILRDGEPGKARARYEFGVKASFAVTNARGPGGQFVLGAQTLPGSPYDGHSLAAQIDQVARLTGRKVRRAYVDRGYRGHGIDREDLQIIVSHTRVVTSPIIRREMRRRNGIEPVLGRMKADGLLERKNLQGPDGDAVNAILCAIGHNCRLLLAWFRRLLARLLISAPDLAATILRTVAAIMHRHPAYPAHQIAAG